MSLLFTYQLVIDSIVVYDWFNSIAKDFIIFYGIGYLEEGINKSLI